MRYNPTDNNESQFKSKSKDRRRRLADDELGRFSGKSDTLLKKTQRKYKIAKKEAEEGRD